MNSRLVVLLLCASLLPVCARATVLPDACGDDKVKFDVKTKTSMTPPAPPIDGKAQIIFLETEVTAGMVLSGVEARLGVDGAWVGATKGNSYFVYSVLPGQHHLCANWSADFAYDWQRTSVAPLIAEAGKVYYFQIKIRHIRFNEVEDHSLDLMPVNEDEGKYLVNNLDLATAKQGK